MHNENTALDTQQLCLKLNIKINQKCRYAFTHIWPLSICIFGFFLYINYTTLVETNVGWLLEIGTNHNGY